uniref:Uncharacterized protein n=1 Tax=Rhizophora mucronata TaxID=61149 RepID=A0A2P2PIJ5_RHIMU
MLILRIANSVGHQTDQNHKRENQIDAIQVFLTKINLNKHSTGLVNVQIRATDEISTS